MRINIAIIINILYCDYQASKQSQKPASSPAPEWILFSIGELFYDSGFNFSGG
jgi:hypothetical protein